MKIAYLINQYPAVTHSFIRREINALEQLGISIERITIRRKLDIIDQEDISEADKTFCILESGFLKMILAGIIIFLTKPLKFYYAFIKAINFGKKSNRGIFRHLIYLLEACVLISWSKKIQIKHIHSHFGTNATTVALLGKILGGPTFSFTCHGSEEFDAPYYIALPEKIEESEFVVAISHFTQSQLKRWCHPDQWSKLQIVHCTVDNSFLEAPKIALPSRNRLICIGKFSNDKGQLFLLDAMKQVVDEGFDLELVLAGDGEMREIITKKIEYLNLTNKVRITGWINGAQVKAEIQSSLALVLPSFAEGLPVVIMEALALGRPVISTYIAGIPELVDSECGYLIPAGSREKLVGAIKRLILREKKSLITMGTKGALRVKKEHNSMIEARKLSELFYKANR